MDDLLEERFFLLETKLKETQDELSSELEILQKTISNLIVGYSEITAMIESLVANIMYEGDEKKIEAFLKAVQLNKEKMLGIIKEELNLDLD